MDNSASSASDTILTASQSRVPPPEPDTLGGRLHALMINSGVSMRKLAHLVGTSQPTVFKWIHNLAEPRIETCRTMAEFFKVKPEWICFGVNEKQIAQQKKALTIDLTVADAERLFGSDFEQLVPVKLECSDMAPQFARGDVVVVDRSAKPEDTDGVFLLRVGTSVLVRRIARQLDGTYRISVGRPDPECPADKRETVEDLHVVGRIVGRLEVL